MSERVCGRLKTMPIDEVNRRPTYIFPAYASSKRSGTADSWNGTSSWREESRMRLIVTCACFFWGDLRIESNVRFLPSCPEVTPTVVGLARSRCGVGSAATSFFVLHVQIRGSAPRITSDVRAGQPVLDPIIAALASRRPVIPAKGCERWRRNGTEFSGVGTYKHLTSTSHVVRWALPSLDLSELGPN